MASCRGALIRRPESVADWAAAREKRRQSLLPIEVERGLQRKNMKSHGASDTHRPFWLSLFRKIEPETATVAAGGDAEWLRKRKLPIYGYGVANRNLSDSSFAASFCIFFSVLLVPAGV